MKKNIKQTKLEPSSSVEAIFANDYRFSRWAALFEGINLIYEHSLDRNEKFNDLDLKPLAIQKYVENKADEILQKMHLDQERKAQQSS
jgi:hypothetical protein